jgi:hypothetical protein
MVRPGRNIGWSAAVVAAGIFLVGCASLREAGKKLWGSSIEHLESARPEGMRQEFSLTVPEAFAATEKALRDSGAQVYLKDRRQRYLAAMNFTGHVDTTQAGVFFDPMPGGDTQVEVASLSPILTGKVAGLVFPALEKAPPISPAAAQEDKQP